VPFYSAADRDVQPVPAPGVACRCCRGGISRSRRARRYPSDMSEAEWAVCEPLLPAPAWLAGRGGRPASWCMRDVVDAIRYLTHNGPVWRALPADFPPAGTVYWWMDKWQAGGSAERMHDDLRDRIRLAAGRTAAPTAAVIDSQSVKGSEMIARTRRGYDAGKKINGTRRHLAVDTLGLLLTVLVTAASVQDRDHRGRHPRVPASRRPARTRPMARPVPLPELAQLVHSEVVYGGSALGVSSRGRPRLRARYW
jgi:transposase